MVDEYQRMMAAQAASVQSFSVAQALGNALAGLTQAAAAILLPEGRTIELTGLTLDEERNLLRKARYR